MLLRQVEDAAELDANALVFLVTMVVATAAAATCMVMGVSVVMMEVMATAASMLVVVIMVMAAATGMVVVAMMVMAATTAMVVVMMLTVLVFTHRP